MSTLIRKLGRLVARLFSADQAALDPETMNLHDWADLPAYHPSGDRAPC